MLCNCWHWKKIDNVNLNELEIEIITNKKTGGEGIEPPTAVPKTDVLPLHQPPVLYFL